MGHFVKTEVALANPFDEQMNAGEDFKYHLQVWRANSCIKCEEATNPAAVLCEALDDIV